MSYVIVMFVVVFCGDARPLAEGNQGDGAKMAAFQAAMGRLKSEGSSERRISDAEEVATLVRQDPGTAAHAEAIVQLSGLLSDKEDGVRYWIATALGYLGPKAKVAIPALEKALAERQNSTASKTSASAIRLALERIRTPKARGK